MLSYIEESDKVEIWDGCY